MARRESSRSAGAMVQRVGIRGETGIALGEGFASSRASTFDDTLGDVIPGASALVSGARRIVLVTDRNVYLFKGSHDRPGEQLAVYQISPAVMSFNGTHLTFPDGQTVFLSAYQGEALAAAASVDLQLGMGNELLTQARITGEQVVAFARGTVHRKRRKSGTEILEDVALGSGLGGLTATSESRMVLVTNRCVYVFRGGRLSKPGTPTGTWQTGAGAFVADDKRLTCPDGEVITFDSPGEAERIASAAGR
jgi:hypothetical protein